MIFSIWYVIVLVVMLLLLIAGMVLIKQGDKHLETIARNQIEGYEKIENGMSYKEVCDIIGKNGNAEVIEGVELIRYTWELGLFMSEENKMEKIYIKVDFENDKVVRKEEKGIGK